MMMTDKSRDSQSSNVHSPLSVPGSSVHSHHASSFEIEESSSAGVISRRINRDWRLGMPWFVGASPSTLSRDQESSDLPRYHGGLMTAEESLAPGKNGKRERKRKTWDDRRMGPALYPHSTRNIPCISTDEETSVGDFSKSEWTPEDSAYGAACPVCGCVPKQVRRLIEFSLIGIMVVGFVWMVIATSIHVTNARRNATMNNSTEVYNDQMIALDDDYYVEAPNDDTYGDVDNYAYSGDDQSDDA